jgi:predicted phage terminase large subunit-like protein
MGKADNNKREAMINALIVRQRELIKNDYWRYCEMVHTDANGDHQWKQAKHLMYLTSEVQRFLNEDTGNPYDIMAIHLPVQTGKSFTLTETLPSYYLGLHPDDGVIIVSYNDDFAQKFGRKNLDKVQRFGKTLFDVDVSKKKKSNDTFEIEGRKGGIISRGWSSGITGNPAALMIIDDVIRNREEADSQNTRDKIWSEWQDSMRSRLKAGAKVIVIMSRWHEDDLIGRMQLEEPNFRYLQMPMECEDENDPIGRNIGDSIAPELGKDNKWKDTFKDTCLRQDGLRTWNSIYQGRPSSEKGNIIKKEWWRYYDVLPRIDLMMMSVDCTFKGKETSDKVAIEIWGKTGSDMYLIDLINKQMGFNDTLSQIRTMKNRYPTVTSVLIEDKANGSAVIETLRSEIMGIIPVEPKGGKESRVASVTYMIESGNVWLPKFASFTEEFVDQCSSFPRGKHDDMVDSMSQMLTRMKGYKAHAPKVELVKDFFFQEGEGGNHKLFGFDMPKSFMKF